MSIYECFNAGGALIFRGLEIPLLSPNNWLVFLQYANMMNVHLSEAACLVEEYKNGNTRGTL